MSGFDFSKVDISPERKIIINMLTQVEFLREFAEYPLHFQTPYAKIVAKWCIEFYQDFETVPGKNIDQIFLDKRSMVDKDEVEAIGRFLTSISAQLDREPGFNLPYELRIAETYLKEQSLKDFRATLDIHIQRGDLSAADALIARYHLPERGNGVGTDFLTDENIIKEAFAREDPYILKYPGALGQIVAGLYPGEVTGFMARTGLGKTWWMIYTFLLATSQGIPTVLVSLEMSRLEVIMRCWQMQLRRRSLFDDIPSVMVPKFESMEGLDYVKHEEIYPKKLERQHTLDEQEGLRYLWNGTPAKILEYDTNTLTMGRLKNDLLRGRQRDKFAPKLLIMDYPAIMDISGKDERRVRMIKPWIELKQLSSELNMASFAGLQVTSDKLKAGQRPDLTSVPEAKDISSHVAQMFALWETTNDVGKGIMRASTIKAPRHAGKRKGDAVISYCHNIGQAYIDSRLSGSVAF